MAIAFLYEVFRIRNERYMMYELRPQRTVYVLRRAIEEMTVSLPTRMYAISSGWRVAAPTAASIETCADQSGTQCDGGEYPRFGLRRPALSKPAKHREPLVASSLRSN
jgi:hypothetical protein